MEFKTVEIFKDGKSVAVRNFALSLLEKLMVFVGEIEVDISVRSPEVFHEVGAPVFGRVIVSTTQYSIDGLEILWRVYTKQGLTLEAVGRCLPSAPERTESDRMMDFFKGEPSW